MESDSSEYLCTPCYTKQDWDQVMPAGYEDLRELKDIAARSKHLGHTAPASDLTLKATRILSSGTKDVSKP